MFFIECCNVSHEDQSSLHRRILALRLRRKKKNIPIGHHGGTLSAAPASPSCTTAAERPDTAQHARLSTHYCWLSIFPCVYLSIASIAAFLSISLLLRFVVCLDLLC